jgi:SOS response regulatory protein OraA/RecX
MLAYRSRSSSEIASDLREKGYTQDIVESVVADLLERDLLDDQALARDMVLLGQRADKGWAKILADLRKRGIGRNLAEESLQGYFDHDMERESVNRLARQCLSGCGSPPEETEVDRIARKICRKGFSPAMVISAIREMTRDGSGCSDGGFLDTDSPLS